MVESVKRVTPGIRQDDDKGYGYEGEKCLLSGIEQADVREREGMRGDGSLRRRQWQRPLLMIATGAEVVDVVKVVLVLDDRLCIEQGLAVVALRGAWLQLEQYSVGLTWHSGSPFVALSSVTYLEIV